MNKQLRTVLIYGGLALAALYSPGCKRDEPVVVRPTINYNGNGINRQYVSAKPARHEGLKDNYVDLVSAKPARHEGLKDNYVDLTGAQYIIVVPAMPDARRNAERARTKPPKPRLSWSEGGRPIADGSSYGSTSGRGTDQLMPNPYTGCNSGSGSSSESSASGSPATNAEPSLEQRLRDCEETIRELEGQANEAMIPGGGRG